MPHFMRDAESGEYSGNATLTVRVLHIGSMVKILQILVLIDQINIPSKKKKKVLGGPEMQE